MKERAIEKDNKKKTRTKMVSDDGCLKQPNS